MKPFIKIFHYALISFLFLFLPVYIYLGEAQTSSILTINTPGEGSTVTSPLALTTEIQPADIQLVRVNLFDPNGTLLARHLLPPEYVDEQVTGLTFSIYFDIPQEESPALLTVDVLDSTFQTQQTRSVLLTLLSTGEANILSKSAEENWLTINSIETIEDANGNQIHITGRLTPITDRPVHFELTTGTGRVIGSKQLAVQNAGIATNFAISIPYPAVTPISRLVVRQTITPYQTNIILDRYSLSGYLP